MERVTSVVWFAFVFPSWACGVILFTLLAGSPPFWHRKQMLMLRMIMEGRYQFTSPEWDDRSDTVKDLVRPLRGIYLLHSDIGQFYRALRKTFQQSVPEKGKVVQKGNILLTKTLCVYIAPLFKWPTKWKVSQQANFLCITAAMWLCVIWVLALVLFLVLANWLWLVIK